MGREETGAMKALTQVLVAVVIGSIIGALAPVVTAEAEGAVVGAGQRVMLDVVLDELDRIDKQISLPPHVVITRPPLDTEHDAISIIAAEPVRFVAIVWEWRIWREAPTRRVVAHEAGHWILASLGLPQSEAAADAFADCYGSTGPSDCSAWQAYIDAHQGAQ